MSFDLLRDLLVLGESFHLTSSSSFFLLNFDRGLQRLWLSYEFRVKKTCCLEQKKTYINQLRSNFKQGTIQVFLFFFYFFKWISVSWCGPHKIKMNSLRENYFSYFLLPCQWRYWHRAKNWLRDKTGFGMHNPQNAEKSGFGQSVCVSVCLSSCLSVWLSLFPRALTGVRLNRSSWNFRGMFGYMGHCAVPIFEAIREPVYKII